MRTTIELPDELLRKAKILAAVEGISLKKFFIDAVERKVSPPAKPKHRREPPVIDTGGPPIPDLTSEQIEEAMLPLEHIVEQIVRGRQ
jgi:hypothetical protein